MTVHRNNNSPQKERNLELEWYEYLLRNEQRRPAPLKERTSKNNYGYYLLFGVIFLLLCYIGSFFIKGLW